MAKKATQAGMFIQTETGAIPAVPTTNGQAAEVTNPPTPTTETEAKAAETNPAASPSFLETMALKLEALAAEAKAMGEDRVAKVIGYGIKSARFADKQHQARRRRVGKLVAALQAKGLSPEEILAQLTK